MELRADWWPSGSQTLQGQDFDKTNTYIEFMIW
jgi:hypothetical protein